MCSYISYLEANWYTFMKVLSATFTLITMEVEMGESKLPLHILSGHTNNCLLPYIYTKQISDSL